MRLIECATVKHSFVWKGEDAELVFNGKTLDLDDDLAAHLLAESPGNFTDVTPPAPEVTEPTPEEPAKTPEPKE
jgi:hypothetical protein